MLNMVQITAYLALDRWVYAATSYDVSEDVRGWTQLQQGLVVPTLAPLETASDVLWALGTTVADRASAVASVRR